MPHPRLAIPADLPAWRERVVAAMLTPAGRGAVATIGLREPEADDKSNAVTKILASHFHPANGRPFEPREADRIYYGHWGNQTPAEDVIVTAARRGYEIHCHGGRAAARGILNDLAAAGALELDWRQWIWLTSASPLAALVALALAQATTDLAATAIFGQEKLLAAEFAALQHDLELATRELCESADHAAAIARCDGLLATVPWGTHLTAPWRVVLAGPPNAGKSSLLNALLGYERAIVFPQPGTTRDVVTGVTAWRGWLWEFRDTAGLRETTDELEAAGVALAEEELEAADAVVLVFDDTTPWRAEHAELLNEHEGALVAINKIDLRGETASAPTEQQSAPSQVEIPLSAKTGQGVESLFIALADRLLPPAAECNGTRPFLFCPELAGEVAAIRKHLGTATTADLESAITQIKRLLQT